MTRPYPPGEELVFTIPGKPAGWRTQHSARVIGKKKAIVTTRLADAADRWQKTAIKQLALEWGSRPPLSQPVKIEVYPYFPRRVEDDCTHKRKPCSCPPEKLDGRRRWHTSTPDFTNVFKLAEDAVVKAGILEDDRLTVSRGGWATRHAKGGEPHVCIIIKTMEKYP